MTYIGELAKALRHEDPELRERVARALAELEDPRATMPLIEALDDEDEDVRRAVTLALYHAADERARGTFIELLGDSNDSVRLWAACGLQRVGDESAVEALIAALSDSYESVRAQAVEALAKIGDRRAIDPLIRALHDEDANVRSVADFHLREAFKIKYDPYTGQTENIFEKNEVEIYALPPEERERIDSQLQTVLKMIKNLEAQTGACRDDKLYDALYADHGIRRKQVARLIAILKKKGSIHTPKSGYYTLA